MVMKYSVSHEFSQFHVCAGLCVQTSCNTGFWKALHVSGSFLAVLPVASSVHELSAIIGLVFIQLLPGKEADQNTILLFRKG